jgi:hypothetical protein
LGVSNPFDDGPVNGGPPLPVPHPFWNLAKLGQLGNGKLAKPRKPRNYLSRRKPGKHFEKLIH